MLLDHQSNVLGTTDVLILCGGLGSRLQPIIPDRPKGLAPVGGKPFLDILVEDLLRQGVRRFVFCVGHLKEQIIERYRDRDDAEYLFSEEDVPLGTGGAIQHALPLARSNPFLVMNGDSLCPVELAKFCSFHHAKEATASFVLAQVGERYDGGVVCLDDSLKVEFFMEKSGARGRQGCFINAGIYLMQHDSIEFLRGTPPFSLEYDVFPALVKSRPCFGFVVGSELVDIGTPERYRLANMDCLK